ncbi:MAG: hypothetical protein QNL04_12690 [SAR324 cluster bacterium]|nr:hypothetical protein [SAR324 cluster bacterium]
MKVLLFIFVSLLLSSCGEQRIGDNANETEVTLTSRTDAMISVSDISVTPVEGGATAEIEITSNFKPYRDVTITLSSANDQVTFSPEQVVFTANNWRTIKTVTVTAVNDTDDDDDRGDTIDFTLETTDEKFLDATLESKSVDITDNDSRIDELKGAKYGLIRSGGSCPTNFTAGNINLDTEDTINNDTIPTYGGDIGIQTYGMLIPLCSLERHANDSLHNAVSTGFAFLRNGGSCPTGTNSGTVRVSGERDNTDSSVVGAYGDSYIQSFDVYLEVCETASGFNSSNLETAGFTIMKNGSCPYSSTKGYIKIDTEDTSNFDSDSGDLGSSYISTTGSSVYLYVCTYD